MPILALVPVLALAAFLVVSSLTASGVQNVEAQDFDDNEVATLLKTCELEVGDATAPDLHGPVAPLLPTPWMSCFSLKAS